MIFIFWISILMILYHLIGYGCLLKFLNLFRKPDSSSTVLDHYPSITVLCPAFNEEKVIEEKIESFLQLDYPDDKLKMIIISDDSTDATNDLVRQYTADHNIELVIQKPRKGKQSGHNLVEPDINSDYVLSTDANSIFHPQAVKKLLKKMNSDPEIAMVSGELRLLKNNGEDSGEGLYWKYESWLKKLESSCFSIIGSNGSIFLIKREFFTQVHPASVDDFERTLHVLKKGKIAKYEPEAVVTEDVTEKSVEEIGRKIRMIAQQWFCLERNTFLLNFFKYGKISFMFFSHKLIRWLLPLFSLMILISSAFLLGNNFYKICFILQLLIYCSGGIEIILESKSKSFFPFKLPAYLAAMNYSALIAFFKYLKREQFSTWKIQR